MFLLTSKTLWKIPVQGHLCLNGKCVFEKVNLSMECWKVACSFSTKSLASALDIDLSNLCTCIQAVMKREGLNAGI